MRALKQNTSRLWSADRLLKIAFDGVGGLPRTKLNSIRRKQQVTCSTSHVRSDYV